MPDADKILSQSEVDALLSAIGSGEVEIPQDAPSEPQGFAYDFKRPQRVTRDQLRGVEALHEAFARNLEASLSALLRSSVSVKLGSVQQLSCEEFLHALPNPTAVAVLGADPLEGSFLLEINPAITFPVIERLLASGRVDPTQPERALTRVEWNILDLVLERLLEQLRLAWADTAGAAFRVVARETEPPLVRAVSPHEPMISIAFEVAMGERSGGVNLAVPVMALEGLMDRIVRQTGASGRRREEAPGREASLSRGVGPAEVRVMAHLPEDTIALGDLRNLRPGDLLLTNHSQSAPVVVAVEGKPKYTAKLGGLRDRKAVKILEGVDPNRPPVADPMPRGTARVRPGGGAAAASGSAGVGTALSGLLDIGVTETVVLAERAMTLREILKLKPGDVLDFSKPITEPLDLQVAGRTVARGTAVRMGERFGLQISEIRDPGQTVRALGS